ncbi:MAG: phosphotransferase, partial [Actinomycetota bacterium]
SLRLAHPLAYSSDHRMLLVEPIRGRAIGRLTGPDLSKGLFAYGAALATLHSLPLDHVPAPSRPQLERLKRKARDIGVVRPDIEARSNELLAEISERWPVAQDAPVFVHGDANENNAIFQNGRVALIDFDRASSGEAASDLGNFLGLLAYFRSLGDLSRGAEVERATAFMHGYASVRDLPNPASLRLFLAASLAERAFRAVNRVRPKALLRAPRLLVEGRSLLHGDGALF